MSARLPLAETAFIADFAAFCRSRGDEIYSPYSPHGCALGRFGYPGAVRAADCEQAGVPVAAWRAAAVDGPFTYAALADRLDALIVDAPVVERAR